MNESRVTPIETIVRREVARAKPASEIAKLPRQFEARGDERYVLRISDLGILIEVDRLRRERHELFGELSAKCDLPGAVTISESGTLSIADLNLSSAQARSTRARMLASRARTNGAVDWEGILEDFCQRVLAAERTGQPAVDLRHVAEAPEGNETYNIMGLTVPRDHPTILFGDGAACKSYIALNFIGKLAENGTRVMLVDWELEAKDHRKRLGRLFRDGLPQIFYVRADRPLIHEVDRLKRIVRDNLIEYSVFDSIAAAADGPPESAEIAGRYVRAVRQIGCGSLHVAHITKAGDNADQKPFGSVFWHNFARSTWFAQKAESQIESDVVQVGLYNRKSNLDRLCPPIGYSIAFDPVGTTIKRTDVAENPDLAAKLSIGQRMYALLRRGPMTFVALSEETGAKIETIERTARRQKNTFMIMPDKRCGLLARERDIA